MIMILMSCSLHEFSKEFEMLEVNVVGEKSDRKFFEMILE